MKSWFLSIADVALVLQSDAQCLRSQARSNPELLGFPVTIIGRRVRIPRIPFLAYVGMTQEDLEERLTEARQKRDRAG